MSPINIYESDQKLMSPINSLWVQTYFYESDQQLSPIKFFYPLSKLKKGFGLGLT